MFSSNSLPYYFLTIYIVLTVSVTVHDVFKGSFVDVMQSNYMMCISIWRVFPLKSSVPD